MWHMSTSIDAIKLNIINKLSILTKMKNMKNSKYDVPSLFASGGQGIQTRLNEKGETI
jgi:hypothetical protein